MIAPLAAAAALLAAPAGHAIEVDKLDVRYEEGRYIVEFEARLDAPAQAVGAVLTDFENYPQLDDRILVSKLEVLPHQPPRLVTHLRGCVAGVFCRTMTRVETIAQRPGELIANAIPEESDVQFGTMFSRWHEADGETVVNYRLVIVPDFWVPPLIGRRAMIRTMRDGTLNLFTNVERFAQEREP